MLRLSAAKYSIPVVKAVEVVPTSRIIVIPPVWKIRLYALNISIIVYFVGEIIFQPDRCNVGYGDDLKSKRDILRSTDFKIHMPWLEIQVAHGSLCTNVVIVIIILGYAFQKIYVIHLVRMSILIWRTTTSPIYDRQPHALITPQQALTGPGLP